jgi:hypothetical protein
VRTVDFAGCNLYVYHALGAMASLSPGASPPPSTTGIDETGAIHALSLSLAPTRERNLQ